MLLVGFITKNEARFDRGKILFGTFNVSSTHRDPRLDEGNVATVMTMLRNGQDIHSGSGFFTFFYA